MIQYVKAASVQLCVVVFALTLVVGMCGCRQSSGGPVGTSSLQTQKRVYVGPISDAQNTDDNTHSGSGQMATAQTRSMLLRLGIPLVDSPESADYLLDVRYTNWEDHATQWNGELDIVAMSFDLTDARSKSVVGHSDSRAKGSWVAFGNERPSRLIDTAVADGICRLYGIH